MASWCHPPTVCVEGAVRVYDPQAQGLACTGEEDRLAEPCHGDLDGLVRLLRTPTPGPHQGRSPSGSRQGEEQKDSLAHHGRGTEQPTCAARPAARLPFSSGRTRAVCATHAPPPIGGSAGSPIGVALRTAWRTSPAPGRSWPCSERSRSSTSCPRTPTAPLPAPDPPPSRTRGPSRAPP